MDDTLAAGWGEFLVASAGAAAALAGLVMVAISVNIKEILAVPSLPARAGAAVGSLVLAVVASLAARRRRVDHDNHRVHARRVGADGRDSALSQFRQ